MPHLEKMLSLFDANNADVWGENLFSLASNYGFNRVLYWVAKSKQLFPDAVHIASNYPTEWRAFYDADGRHAVDPTVEHCLKSSIPLIWTGETFKTPDQQALYEEACGFGLRQGISFPIHGSNGEFGMVSFVTDKPFHTGDNRLSHQVLGEMSLIRDYAFESSLKFLGGAGKAHRAVTLTPRELECLKWVAEGKTSWAISKILGCAEVTVNFHIKNVKHKFNVDTRQQAVAKAISLGVFELR